MAQAGVQIAFPLESKAGGAPFTPNTDPMFNAQPRFWPGAGGGSYTGALTWRAIDLLSSYVKRARTRWIAAGTEDTDEPKFVDLPSLDKVASLFKRPNLQMDWSTMRYACETYRMLYGGWIAVKLGADGKPTDRFPISLLLFPIGGFRRCVGGKPSYDQNDFYRGDSWRNDTLGLTVYDTQAVVYRNFDPTLRNNYVSQAGFAHLAQEVLLQTQRYQQALLTNDNRPGVIVMAGKTVKEDNRARLQGEMMANYGGVVNAGRLMLLSGDGMEWKVQPVDPLKLTEISNQDHSRDLARHVGAPFGVPEFMLTGNMDNANKANVATIRANFLVDTVEPNFMSFEETWNRQFFEFYDLPVRLDLDQWSLSAFRDVAADRMGLVRLRLETGDTPREAYKFAGIPFVANSESEKPTMASTIVQILPPAPVVAPAPANDKPVAAPTDEGKKPAADSVRQEQSTAGAKPKKALPVADRKGFEVVRFVQSEIKRIQGRAEEKRRALAERIFARCVDPFEAAHKAATEKAFRHAKGETVKKLVTFLNTGRHLAKDARELTDRSIQINLKAADPKIPGPGDLDAFLPDGDALSAELRGSWLATFLDVGIASQTQMEAELGDIGGWMSKPLDFRRAPAMDRLADAIQISETVRRDVKTALSKILQTEANASASQIAKALRDGVDHVFQDAFSRTTTIARTELSGVLSGYRQGIMAANGVKRIQWVSAGDTHVRDSHLVLNGKTTDLGVAFEGSALRWPHDPNGSAEDVINCRCVAVAAQEKR